MTIARQLSSLRNLIQRTKTFEVHPTTKLSFFVLSSSFSE